MSSSKIRDEAPAIFAKGPVDKASERYTFVPTTTLINDFSKLGWKVNRVSQANSRVDPLHTKHMVVLRNSKLPMINGCTPEVVMINSHNRTCSFKFMVGLFRFLCENGLIVSMNTFDSLHVKHINYEFEDLKEMMSTVVANTPKLVGVINHFDKTLMSEAAQMEFATRAIATRFTEYTDKKTKAVDINTIKASIDMASLLNPVRQADTPNTVWAVYNRIQEKIIKGGFQRITLKDSISRRVRPVSSIGLDVAINKSLWELATEYAT